MEELQKSWEYLSQEMGITIKFIKSQCDIFGDGDNTGKTQLIQQRIDTGQEHPMSTSHRINKTTRSREISEQGAQQDVVW